MLEVMCVAGLLFMDSSDHQARYYNPNQIISVYTTTRHIYVETATGRDGYRFTEGNDPNEEFMAVIEIWSACKNESSDRN